MPSRPISGPAARRRRTPASRRRRNAAASLEAVVLAKPQFLLLATYREAHPTFTALAPGTRLLGRLGCKAVAVPFRQLACPAPECLDLVEELQRLRLEAEEQKP